jgi:hypothetical protein
VLKSTFDTFRGASGLGYNLSKCQFAPIRCDETHLLMATTSFPCQVVEFAVRYLGIPLSVHQLPKVALQPLVDKVVDRHPVWRGSMMNKSGWLALIKSTLLAIPIHTCLILDMPPWFTKALNKIFKAFLWSGTDVMHGGKCAMAWVRVQRPLALGDLGIFDPNRLGIAMHACWLWLQHTDLSRPWLTMPF